MQLKDLDLLQLQTKFMKEDITTQGFCAAINSPMKNIAENTSNILLWNNYDTLSNDVCDTLAKMLNISWYDVNAELEVKQHLIEYSDEVHLYLGTARGIQLVFEAWDVTVRILEWFNYDGAPYHYKLVIDYTTHEPLIDADGNAVYDADGLQIFVLRETPYLPNGTLITKLTALLPILQPARCILDSITTTAEVIENTYADIEALGTYADLEGSYYWDLQYQT